MTTNPPDRLDRIEIILLSIATQQETNTTAISQLTEKIDNLTLRVDSLTTEIHSLVATQQTLIENAEADRTEIS